MNASTDKYIGIGKWAAARAFRHVRADEESPLAYFNGAHRATAPRATKAKPRIHVTHATATRNSGTSRPPLIGNQELHGWIHRAISELDPMHGAWVQFRYREPGVAKSEYHKAFYRAYSDYYISKNLKGCRTGTRRIVRQLVDFVLLGVGGEPDPAGFDLSRDQWRQTYRPHLRKIREEIAQIDADAMYSLGLIVEQEWRE